MFRQHTVTPIRNAAHGLHPARACRWARVQNRVFVDILSIGDVKTLLEASPHPVPCFTVRVTWEKRYKFEPNDTRFKVRTDNGFIGRNLDIMWKCKPVIASKEN